MQIDPAHESPATNYKLLTNLVVPRPIAWITSRGPEGVTNLAPFSFFNAVGGNPAYLVASVGLNDTGGLKDTARNIEATGEFVVNMVTEERLHAMNLSAADFPPEISEVEICGLHTAPSAHMVSRAWPRRRSAWSANCTRHNASARTR